MATSLRGSARFWDRGEERGRGSVQGGPSPPSWGPDPGRAGAHLGCSVLCRYLPPAAQPRFSCTTLWVLTTRGSWWKAFTSAACWSPQWFLKGAYGPHTCWWVGVSDVNPCLFSGDSAEHVSPIEPLVRVKDPNGGRWMRQIISQ